MKYLSILTLLLTILSCSQVHNEAIEKSINLPNSNSSETPKETLLNFYVTESDIYLNDMHICSVNEMLKIDMFYGLSKTEDSRIADSDYGQISHTIKYRVKDALDSLSNFLQVDTLNEPMYRPNHNPHRTGRYMPFHDINEEHPLGEATIFASKMIPMKIINNLITLCRKCGILEVHLGVNTRYRNKQASHTVVYNWTRTSVWVVKRPRKVLNLSNH